MPRFAYTTGNADGTSQTDGMIEALSRREALRLLQARGIRVVGMHEQAGAQTPAKAAAATTGNAHFAARLRLPFFEALGELVQAEMSAGEAVRLLATRLQEPKLRALCGALWTRLGEGRTLSRAMAETPQVFDVQSVNLIAAGEATGNLREVLSRLVHHHREQRELRQKLLAALTYPAFICLLGSGVTLFLLFFLVPRLQTLLNSLGGNLPLSTRLLISGSHALIYTGPVFAVVLVLAIGAFLRWRATPAGRRQSDAALLRLPVVRNFVLKRAVLDFASTLAVLLENGVTTAEALRLTERAVRNTRVQEMLHEATDRVVEGASLCSSLGQTDLISPIHLDRLAVGEQTGKLAPGLRQIAQSYQTALSQQIQTATRLMSGTVLFLTFGFVAFLAYAIVTALFQVSASFRL
ncbi:MAG: type II secretion system F family protein [Opitutaceae bacterium]|nr:type II secretion system F family protein [Opitutaceae bacterium]